LNDVNATWNGKYYIPWDSVLVGKLGIPGFLSPRDFSCEKPLMEFTSKVDKPFSFSPEKVHFSLRLVLTAYQNLFLCFFVFVVCRFCTSKRSFGYVFLDLARCVFVEVFVCD
jgi:hypothetical protein